MLAWLRDAYDVAKESLGLSRLKLSDWIATAVVVVAFIYGLWTGGVLTGVEKGLIASLLFAVFVCVTVIRYAVKLRRQTRPKVRLSCSGSGCLVETPIQFLGEDGMPRWASRNVFVRVEVTNI